MTRISDEIREWCKWCDEHSAARDSLCKLADRIDTEMVELPRDRDGVPIHVGDTAWFVGRDDVELKVDHITFFKDKTRVVAMSDEHAVYSNPADFIHGRPDSWERIADEIERYANDSRSEDEIDGMTASTLVDFAERIRKLAKKDDDDGPF